MTDWKLLWSTFALLFVAELGDKTQLAVILTSARSDRPWTVFLGAALALITVTLIGTLAGQVIARFVSPDLLRKAAGVERGSGEPNREKVGHITRDQLEEIAKMKMKDLNAINVEGAMRQIEGTARSMGITITD